MIRADETKCGQSENHVNIKYVPPEGGWGYVVSIALAIMFASTVGVLSAFGIIYGDFLADIGDEASGTTILFSVFNTVLCFMGLIANHFLKSHSYRMVGLIGSLIYFSGNFLSIFASSLSQIVFTFGILQGIGFGLMLPASLGSFNTYFMARKNVIMAVSQLITGGIGMITPLIARAFMDQFGYRGTVALFAGISLNAMLAMVTLQPVDWHHKKVIQYELEDMLKDEKLSKDKTIEKIEENISFLKENPQPEKIVENRKKGKIWTNISSFLELSLLKDLTYVNLAFGISFSFMSDLMFLSLLPMLLSHMNYSKSDVAFVMTLYMIADLAGRAILSVVSGLCKIQNRFIFLFGTMATAALRIVFTLLTGYIEQICICFLMGLLRCTIQVLPPLVFADYSREKFTAAFGLYLTICGIVSLALGPISSGISLVSMNDIPLIHFLTILLLLCGIPWILEILCTINKKK